MRVDDTVISEIDSAIQRLRQARDRGVAWMLEHIGGDGKPVGADVQNGWSRVPWALAVCGESAAGSAVLGWAERNALAVDGYFNEGAAGRRDRFGAYPLAHFAIGAWFLERYDLALRCMAALRRLQDPATGGIPLDFPGGEMASRTDLLSTGQTGVAALVTGQDDIIDGVYRWLTKLVREQPEFPTRFYTMRDGPALLLEPEQAFKWTGVTDFTLPRQSYYTPGMAAVFLAGVAMRRADTAALSMGHQLLELNINGTAAQFDDLDSVQVCKFAWGAAAMQVADPTSNYLGHLIKMADWFIERQSADGAWTPSRFAAPEPNDIQRLTKTAEHCMEVNAILAALGTAKSRT